MKYSLIVLVTLLIVGLVFGHMNSCKHHNHHDHHIDSPVTKEAVEAFDCPNDCNSQGYCRHRVCHCFDGFGGDDCSIFVETLENDIIWTHNQVLEGEWRFYKVVLRGRVTNDLYLNYVEFRDLWEKADGDIYIAKNRVPSQDDYDFKDESSEMIVSLEFPDLDPGHYFIGIYGYYGVDYKINVQWEEYNECKCECECDEKEKELETHECPNNCSNNGICRHRVCHCFENYGGEDCSTVTTNMFEEELIQDFVDTSEWVFYKIILPDYHYGIQLSYQELRNSDPDKFGDGDIYVARNRLPSKYDYDYMDNSGQESVVMNLRALDSGHYFIGIYGYRAVEFQLSFVFLAHDLSNIQTLENKVGYHGMAGSDKWTYFKYSTNSPVFYCMVKEESMGGHLVLLENMDSVPSWSDYDNVDNNQFQYHQIMVTNTEDDEVHDYYFGILPDKNVELCNYGIVIWDEKARK